MRYPDAEKNPAQTGLQIPHLLRNPESLGRPAEVPAYGRLEKIAGNRRISNGFCIGKRIAWLNQ